MDFMAILAEEKRKAREKVRRTETPPQEERKGKEIRSKDADFPALHFFERLSGAEKMKTLEGNLESLRVGKDNKLNAIYYMNDFVNEEEEEEIRKHLYCDAARWVELKYRRLQCYGQEHEAMPPWLEFLAEKLVECTVFPETIKPNNALINEYSPGQGILGHTDGPCYHPLVACVSLGSPALLTFKERLSSDLIGEREAETFGRVLLRPRSIVIFRDDAYEHALHEIAPVVVEQLDDKVVNLLSSETLGQFIVRQKRVSITLRTLK